MRGKQVLLFGSEGLTTKMTKAHTIRNYPGLPDITGTDLADKLKHHLDVMGVEITEKQVTTVYAMGSYFGIQTPDIMYEASSVILAGGVVMGKPFPGEDELLGRGVSYCATCDAHFYKGQGSGRAGLQRRELPRGRLFAETCARVLYFPVVPHEVNVGPNVTVVRERVLSIPGTMRAEGVQTDKDLHPVDGVFVLRDAVAPDKLVPGLATDGPHVAVDAQMRTNLPGCFACGDLAGKPLPVYQGCRAGQHCRPVGGGMAGRAEVTLQNNAKRPHVSAMGPPGTFCFVWLSLHQHHTYIIYIGAGGAGD